MTPCTLCGLVKTPDGHCGARALDPESCRDFRLFVVTYLTAAAAAKRPIPDDFHKKLASAGVTYGWVQQEATRYRAVTEAGDALGRSGFGGGTLEQSVMIHGKPLKEWVAMEPKFSVERLTAVLRHVLITGFDPTRGDTIDLAAFEIRDEAERIRQDLEPTFSAIIDAHADDEPAAG